VLGGRGSDLPVGGVVSGEARVDAGAIVQEPRGDPNARDDAGPHDGDQSRPAALRARSAERSLIVLLRRLCDTV